MSSQPSAPALFADCLFNTTILPPTITDRFGTTYNKIVGLASSINGVNYTAPDPESHAQLTRNIDNVLSNICYGSFSGGFHSTNKDYSTGDIGVPCTPTLSPATCRYVVMHAADYAKDAHQMLVDAAGNPTYIYTNWTS